MNYHIEPSFYTGSMYVSYGVGIAIAVAVFMLSIIFNIELGPKELLISIIVALIITMPYIGAVSKAIWAHLFIKYNPEIAKKVQNDKRT